jgi:hypothetical protein
MEEKKDFLDLPGEELSIKVKSKRRSMVNWSSPSHHSHLSEEEKQPEQDKKSIVPSSSRRSLAPMGTLKGIEDLLGASFNLVMSKYKEEEDKQPEENKNERWDIVVELRKSEIEFVRILQRTVRAFKSRLTALERLGRPILTSEEIGNVFQNIEEILALHQRILKYMENLRLHVENEEEFIDRLPDMFMKFIPGFQVYTQYVTKFESSARLLDEIKRDRKDFREFLEVIETCEGVSLNSYLVHPVKRIQKYINSMASLKRLTSDDNPSKENMNRAYQQLDEISRFIATNMDQFESVTKVEMIQKSLSGDVNLVKIGRYFILDGTMKFVSKTSGVKGNIFVFYLLTDVLIMCSTPSRFNSKMQLKFAIPILGMELYDVPDSDNVANAFAFKSSILSGVIIAGNSFMKKNWVNSLNLAINSQTEKIQEAEKFSGGTFRRAKAGTISRPLLIEAPNCMICNLQFSMSVAQYCMSCLLF